MVESEGFAKVSIDRVLSGGKEVVVMELRRR